MEAKTAEPIRPLGTRCCPGPGDRAIPPREAERAAGRLAVLAHPIRLTLLGILGRRGGDVCVCDLEAAVPVKQPTVSHHLRLLREAGLVHVERRGQWAHYRLEPGAAEALAADLRAVLSVLEAATKRSNR
jgi:ArsR family transcriptional regulator